MIRKDIESLAGKNLKNEQFRKVRTYFLRQKSIPHHPTDDGVFDILDEHWIEGERTVSCEVCGKNGKLSKIRYTTGAEFMESYPTVLWWYGSDDGLFGRNYKINLTEEGKKELERFGELDKVATNPYITLLQYRIYCQGNVEKNAVVCDKCKDTTLPPSIAEHVKNLEAIGINLNEVRITTETGVKKILTKISDEKNGKETILLKSLIQK